MVSPRVAGSSSSRRRRRRKNSQSDSKRQLSGVVSPIPHCVSPVEATPKSTVISNEPITSPAEGDSPPELFTPVSSGRRNDMNGEKVSSGKAKNARTRLLRRFEVDGSQESGGKVQVPLVDSTLESNTEVLKEIHVTGEMENPKKSHCGGSVVQPASSGRFVKGGWANLPKM